MGKVYTRFQAKTAHKPYPDGAVHTYIAYIREYPPPPPSPGSRGKGKPRVTIVKI